MNTRIPSAILNSFIDLYSVTNYAKEQAVTQWAEETLKTPEAQEPSTLTAAKALLRGDWDEVDRWMGKVDMHQFAVVVTDWAIDMPQNPQRNRVDTTLPEGTIDELYQVLTNLGYDPAITARTSDGISAAVSFTLPFTEGRDLYQIAQDANGSHSIARLSMNVHGLKIPLPVGVQPFTEDETVEDFLNAAVDAQRYADQS